MILNHDFGEKMTAPTTHEILCQDPWFSYLKEGKKPVEGRKGTPKYREIRAGDCIRFVKPEGGESFLMTVKKIDAFRSLDDYLNGVGLTNALPGVKTLEEGRNIYLQWSTEKQIAEHGFLGIWVAYHEHS